MSYAKDMGHDIPMDIFDEDYHGYLPQSSRKDKPGYFSENMWDHVSCETATYVRPERTKSAERVQPTTSKTGKEFYLNFGKYSGFQLSQIMKDDPSYISWMLNNNPVFCKAVATHFLFNQ